jgi:hypothetical protein
MVVLFSLAALRVLYLIAPSLITESAILLADMRRNGLDVIKAAFWWSILLCTITLLTLLF